MEDFNNSLKKHGIIDRELNLSDQYIADITNSLAENNTEPKALELFLDEEILLEDLLSNHLILVKLNPKDYPDNDEMLVTKLMEKISKL